MDDRITLDYGSGGKKTARLIGDMILPLLGNDALRQLGDGAVVGGAEQLVFSTDSFVVTPCFFPGGDIGKLAVCGTVNDIAMAGGEPKYLSLGLVIEEGFLVEDLRRILESIRAAAAAAGVQVVTGDTKVVERGRGDGVYINTSGIGFLKTPSLHPSRIQPGDRILVSGTVGDHGAAVMLARNEGLLNGGLKSDCAAVHAMALALGALGDDLRVMRDPTRGGAATVLAEFAEEAGLAISAEETAIPVDSGVQAACDLLGLDPLYCACEGRLMAVVAADRADEALEILRAFPEGKQAQLIGEAAGGRAGRVTLHTAFGGSRILTRLSGAQLPRIC